MPLLQFFCSPNLREPVLTEAYPWDFCPDDAARQPVAAMPKAARQEFMSRNSTQWNIYSTVRAAVPGERASKVNPPAALRGLAVDYDMRTTVEAVVGYLNQVNEKFLPNFIEVSLSKRIRLVWVFEREILTPNAHFAGDMIEAMFEAIGVKKILAGYDPASAKPEMVWTNGGEWHTVKATPLSWDVIFGILARVGKRSTFGQSDIPLETIYEQIKIKFPARWKGDFTLNATGVRFWDERADSAAGCQVKADGMLCFTGSSPFMKWDVIFGASWANAERSSNLGKLAGEIYFDGQLYWERHADQWRDMQPQNVVLALKTRGLSAQIAKGTGDTSSQVDKVLHHIQNVNRVLGAAPVVNQRPGLLTLDGKHLLNINTVRALEPAPGKSTPEQFPWTWDFLNGLFERPERRPLDHFLAWLKRSYVSIHDYRKANGQAVFLCGPKENGKSLLCFHILKPLLGNKIANPYSFFIGDTLFNDELFESALLAINDEEGISDDRTRNKFLAKLKSFCVNPSHTYHPKFCKRVNIEWTGRIFVTLNDDPASVCLLPEVNSNTEDKLSFYASRPYSGTWQSREVIEDTIAAELPFFARWLMDWQAPAEILVPGRMEVRSYFDPHILELSRQQIPAYGLIEIFELWVEQSAYWGPGIDTWEGTPERLYQALEVCDPIRGNLKEWGGGTKVARALRTLSQLKFSGVELVSEDNKRIYRVHRKFIDKKEKEKP